LDRFREKCDEGLASVDSLLFLKSSVSPLVDHGLSDEENLMQSLICQLLSTRFMPSLTSDHGAASSRNGNPQTEFSSVLRGDSQLSSGLPASLPRSDSTLDTTLRDSTRLAQRTAVFERILQYVKNGVREPDEDLGALVSKSESAQLG
jgi:hypothetical protein